MQWRRALRNRLLKCLSLEKRFARSIETIPCARADSDKTISRAGLMPIRPSALAWSIRTMIIAVTGERPAAKSPGYCRASGAGRKNAASKRCGCLRAKFIYASVSSSSHAIGSCSVRERTASSHAARPSSTNALNNAPLSAKCRYSAIGDRPARAATLRIVRFAMPSRSTMTLAAERIRSLPMCTLYTSGRTMYTCALRLNSHTAGALARWPSAPRQTLRVLAHQRQANRANALNECRGKPTLRARRTAFGQRK